MTNTQNLNEVGVALPQPCSNPELLKNTHTMTNSENIQLAADHKRSEAKKKLAQMFRIPEGYSSGTVEQIVDDIITAAILEISSIQAKSSESNSGRCAASALAGNSINKSDDR